MNKDINDIKLLLDGIVCQMSTAFDKSLSSFSEQLNTRLDHVSRQLDHVSEQTEHLNTRLDHVYEQTEHLNTRLDHVSGRQEEMAQEMKERNMILFDMSSFAFDAYETISKSSGISVNDANLRQTFLDNYSGSVNENKKKVWCYLTGYQQAKSVKLSHICPKTADGKIQKTLGLSEVDIKTNFKNIILLSWNIKYYFDRKMLSFVQDIFPHDRLVLKIRDESICDIPIFKGSTKTIGDFNGKPLRFLKNHEPYRRCFAYQELCAYNDNVRNKGYLDDFSSDGRRSKVKSFIDHRKAILGQLRIFREIRNKEIAE